MNENHIKIRPLKSYSKQLVKQKTVNKNSIYFLNIFLPLFVGGIILALLSTIIPITFTATILYVIELLCYSAFTLSVSTIIKTNECKAKFILNRDLFSVFALISLVSSVLTMFLSANFFTLIFCGILNIGLIIISLPVIFLVGLRDYPFVIAVREGVKLGHEYFWPILKLTLSFIPMFILGILTFGILFIFQGTYIFTSYGILCAVIFERKRLM